MERRKAKFIGEYRKLCERYKMLVAIRPPESEGDYVPFVVVDVREDLASIDRSCEEMLIEKTMTILDLNG